MGRGCRRCGRPVDQPLGAGRPRAFCSHACRQAAYVERLRNAESVEHALVVTRDELERLRDDLYVLACAVQDAEQDLADAVDPAEVARQLLEAARPLIGRGLGT